MAMLNNQRVYPEPLHELSKFAASATWADPTPEPTTSIPGSSAKPKPS